MGILHLSHELRLLRCTFTDSSESLTPQPEAGNNIALEDCAAGPNFDASLQSMVEHIENGEYFRAFGLQAVLVLLGVELNGAVVQSRDWFKAQEARIKEIVTNQVSFTAGVDEDEETHSVLILAVGVASLLTFLEANLTGPQVNVPSFAAQNGVMVNDNDDPWACQYLMIDGCDLLGKLHMPEYLVLAKHLLVDVKTKQASLTTKSWWALRTLLTHQRCLAERSYSLQSQLNTLSTTMLSSFGSPAAVHAQEWSHLLLPGEPRLLAAAAQLEGGLVEHAFGHDNKARVRFESAEQTCGLELSLTGVLGFCTIYQVDAKAPMVLLANSNPAANSELEGLRKTSRDEIKEKGDQGEIMLAPKLLEGQGAEDSLGAKQASGILKVFSSIEQAVILAKCLDVKRSNPDDELRAWQMAPYIEAVSAQPQSDPMVRALCELLRIRWERLRSRTKERAYLTMEKMEEELRGGTTKTAVRMCHVFSVAFPMMSAFLKEQAEFMVSFGLVGEAMRVFEELELWDNLIDCYCLLDKKAAATDLINQRLKSHPNDPRLWCSLGDVTLSDECYLKAWEVSKHRYARAQRSLGRTAYARGDFVKSMEHWNLALALNPLHPDGWFALGSAAVKAKDMDVAVNAFTRSVQLNPDNGESWNNLAALNMVKKRSKEAFVAFREALKYKRNSWQMWENFALVSVDISNYSQAALALSKVLELSDGKRIDLITLTKLFNGVEKRKIKLTSLNTLEADDPSTLEAIEGGMDSRLDEIAQKGLEDTQELASTTRETNTLFDIVGKLLNQVVQSAACGGEVWGLKARWHHANGELTMCTEAALKQVRAFQGTSWQQNLDKFETFAIASLQLCEAYIESSCHGGGVKELSAAIMHLRNTLKQGHEFSASDRYKELEACLQEAEKSRATILARKQDTQVTNF